MVTNFGRGPQCVVGPGSRVSLFFIRIVIFSPHRLFRGYLVDCMFLKFLLLVLSFFVSYLDVDCHRCIRQIPIHSFIVLFCFNQENYQTHAESRTALIVSCLALSANQDKELAVSFINTPIHPLTFP